MCEEPPAFRCVKPDILSCKFHNTRLIRAFSLFFPFLLSSFRFFPLLIIRPAALCGSGVSHRVGVLSFKGGSSPSSSSQGDSDMLYVPHGR